MKNSQTLGFYQKIESLGIISAVVATIVVALGSLFYTTVATGQWANSEERIVVTSLLLAVCAAVVFICGYARNGFGKEGKSIARFIRRSLETISLAVVYAVSVGLITSAIQVFIMHILGSSFSAYELSIVCFMATIVGYMVYVQAALLNSRTIATLLPFFIISGVTLAGMASDDPHWWKNNFSQLGDNTTFGARTFNFTLILGGITMIIISYFAISEIITQHRLSQRAMNQNPETREFHVRITLFSILLISAGIMFGAIGVFRYSPHPFLHNLFARGIAVPMTLLMIGMPWFVHRFSYAFYVISDVILLILAGSYIYWFAGHTSLTNVEALAVVLFMGWFILFSRQIAALEADRFALLDTLPREIVEELGHSRLDHVSAESE